MKSSPECGDFARGSSKVVAMGHGADQGEHELRHGIAAPLRPGLANAAAAARTATRVVVRPLITCTDSLAGEELGSTPGDPAHALDRFLPS
jgi:hypothetical protein